MKRDKNNKKSGGPVKVWTFEQANNTIPYVRFTLDAIRLAYINTWHLFKKNRYDRNRGEYHEEIERARATGVELLAELDRLGVLLYQSPLRGIALFPTFIHFNDGSGTTPREACFVYKNSRPTIDSFVFNDELCTYHDLYGWEKPVRESWKRPEVVPKLSWTDLG
jgi:hypothetical protein